MVIKKKLYNFNFVQFLSTGKYILFVKPMGLRATDNERFNNVSRHFECYYEAGKNIEFMKHRYISMCKRLKAFGAIVILFFPFYMVLSLN